MRGKHGAGAQPGVMLRQWFTLLFDQWWEQNHPYPQEAMNVSRQLWEHLATCPTQRQPPPRKNQDSFLSVSPETMPVNLLLHCIISLKREQKQFSSPISGELAGIHLHPPESVWQDHSTFSWVASSMRTLPLSVVSGNTHTILCI